MSTDPIIDLAKKRHRQKTANDGEAPGAPSYAPTEENHGRLITRDPNRPRPKGRRQGRMPDTPYQPPPGKGNQLH